MAHKEQMIFCEEIKRNYPNFFRDVKVLDIGSMDLNGNNRYLFKDSDYIGCDLGDGSNVDVVCAGHDYPAQPNSLDVVISTEAFEHDRYLDKTLKHAVNILRPGGLFIFTCATGNRVEHGTKKCTPWNSPFTNDYYCNVSEEMVCDAIDVDKEFLLYEFRKLNDRDLYFYGIKKGHNYERLEEWDWKRYLDTYKDLREAGINTPEAAQSHWINQGSKENRRLEKKICLQTMSREFWDKGYVRLGKIFNDSEVEALKSQILTSDEMKEHYYNAQRDVEKGGHPHNSTIFVMNEFDNIFGRACLRPSIVDNVSHLFGDDAYLYHSKVPLKYAGMIGFSWHQDYYYWYEMGCSLPDLATCFIAVDPATKENGCLKIIPHSHKCGRINHVLHNGTVDSECDPQRVAFLENKYGIDYIELEPGEVILFHCNVLHSSDDNHSDISRLAVLGCFNTKLNSPLDELHQDGKINHPAYSRQPRFDKLC